MKLNRNNYEEYFILYLDNELGSEDRREVENFANENPDLKAELDILLQSKFSPDIGITFNNKESLMAGDSSSISMNNYEEWLLSYTDNELTAEERKDVEGFVAEYPSVKKEFDLLQQTKLQPEEIVFPDKESLYRKEEKVRVVAMRWWRIAAAAVLLIGISTTAIVLINNKSGGGKVDLAKEGEPVIKIPTGKDDVKQPGNTTPENQEIIAGNESPKTESPIQPKTGNAVAAKKDKKVAKEKNVLPFEVKTQEAVIAKNDIEKKPDNNLPRPENNPNIITGEELTNTIAQANPSKNPSLTNSKANQGDNNVTTKPDDTYNKQEKALGDQQENPDAIFASNDGKKNKLRGFFRKVTRTFEKRTNIKATDDDDDRLLIAGLAIKLN
ncbi:MAG: hypothetical protein WDO71_01835 [Bacteroidota bacterium]